MRDTGAAFNWIIDLLETNGIPYQIIGGFAAKAYGATRELWDIDIYVSGKNFPLICRLASSYTEWGPGHYKDESWDCEFVKLRFNGQQIDIGNADNTRWYDREAGAWVTERVDFSSSTPVNIMGRDVPVMPKSKLIEYKRKLGRKVDLEDLEQMPISCP